MNDAWKKTIRDVAIIAAAGFIYYLIYRFTGWGLPCLLRNLTGLKCPSCGVSHMCIHMASLEFDKAYKDNQIMFITWPLIVTEIIYIIYRHESGKDLPKWNVAAISIFATALTIFGVLRVLFSW